MIFHFPDLETFRLALTSGIIPTVVSLGAALVSFDEVGNPLVEPANAPRNLAANLKKLGVKTVKDHVGTPESVTCWPQILPVTRDRYGISYANSTTEAKAIPGQPPPSAHALVLTSQTPVIFELSEISQLSSMVSEMLRLGNDRQGYRRITDEESDQRVLLRVVGPPYYTLLRALDPTLEAKAVAPIRAYVERAPRVWVEIGYQHDLAKQIQPAEGQMVLLRAPREWLYLENALFHDVYEVLQFQLPDSGVTWQDAPLASKVSVPLRLVPGNAAESPEMWVIRHDAVNQLDTLVRDANEVMMARLSFAVAEEDQGQRTIILRVRPSKLPPPVLELVQAIGFKPYWKLPNLFLPVGTRLLPTLRREKIRQLLADDPSQVVWLYPEGLGRFVPEVLPDSAFRPLEEWIEYVVDHDQQTLATWIEATTFDFEAFQCKEEQAASKSGGGPGKGRGKGKEIDERTQVETDASPPPVKGKKVERSAPVEEYSTFVQAKPSELKLLRDALETQFLQHEGTLDAPARLELWPQLAPLHAALGDTSDAAVCWMNAIWESDVPAPEWAEQWLMAERKSTDLSLSIANLEKSLSQPSPAPADVRALVATIVWGIRDHEANQAIQQHLSAIQRYLETNEKHLGVRSVWLAWTNLATLMGADVLALARVRDRLLNRLLEEGLNAERDLPTFLRFAGLHDSDRMRVVRDRALKLRELAMRWNGDIDINKPYIDLMFSYGMARLGEATTAKELLANATKAMKAHDRTGKADEVHSYLLDAFEYRIETALAGKSHTGPLTRELHDRHGKLQPLSLYIVDRMREQSRILEPQEKFDPYRIWKKHAEDLYRELAQLPEIKDANVLMDRIRRMLRDGIMNIQSAEIKLVVMADALPLAPRVSEEFTLELLQQVPAVIEAASTSSETLILEKQGALLERSLFLAAHFDRPEQVQLLTQLFLRLLKGKTGKSLYDSINLLVGECMRSLRKVGMRDEIHPILQQMMQLVVQGMSMSQLRTRNGTNWPELMRTLLHLGSGWLQFGAVDQALPFLDEARNELFVQNPPSDRKLNAQDYTKLARTYATVLGHAPVDMALKRIEELFERMNKLPNTFTTASHYSRLHLNIVEDVVRSIISEDFALGPTAKRWLDEDEYLVRRRIHRDMRKQLSQSGL